MIVNDLIQAVQANTNEGFWRGKKEVKLRHVPLFYADALYKSGAITEYTTFSAKPMVIELLGLDQKSCEADYLMCGDMYGQDEFVSILSILYRLQTIKCKLWEPIYSHSIITRGNIKGKLVELYPPI